MENKNQRMVALVAPTIRTLIAKANEAGIKKEDIVTILHDGYQCTLVYFK